MSGKNKTKDPKTLEEFLQGITFKQFLEYFLSVWDFNENKFVPWKLWPAQHQMCDMLDNDKKIFWAKARQVGGSAIAGAYASYVALSEPRSRIIVVSKSEKDAKVFLRDRIRPVLDTLPKIQGLEWGKWEPYVDRLDFSNESTIECLTTSEDAGRGMTLRLVVLDEAAAIEHAQDIWKSAAPTIENVPKGQLLVISNSKNNSWFNLMYRKIMDGDVKGVNRYFLSCWAHPNRTEEWRDETKSQYPSEVDFYKEFPETEEQMFLSNEGCVFPNFDPIEGGSHVNSFEPDWVQRYIYGYDDGFVHYAVFLQCLYDPYSDHLFVLDEMYETQKDTSQLCKLMMKKIFWWRGQGAPANPWRKIADTAIFANKGQKTVAELIRMQTGISFQKSMKHDEEGSTSMLRMRFTNNKITIHPRCHNLVRQIRDLMFDKNGKARDADNDGIDVLRYICAEIKHEEKILPKPPPPAYSLEGRIARDRFKRFVGDTKNPSISGELETKAWQAC